MRSCKHGCGAQITSEAAQARHDERCMSNPINIQARDRLLRKKREREKGEGILGRTSGNEGSVSVGSVLAHQMVSSEGIPAPPRSQEPIQDPVASGPSSQDVCQLDDDDDLSGSSRSVGGESPFCGGKYSLPGETRDFFRSFGDSSEPVYSMSKEYIVNHKKKIDNLSADVKELLTFCMAQFWSAGVSAEVYSFCKSLHQERVKDYHRIIEDGGPTASLLSTFSKTLDGNKLFGLESSFNDLTSNSFSKLLLDEKKSVVVEEGWRKANIVAKVLGKTDRSRLGSRDVEIIVHPGVFRPITDVLVRVLDENGGLSCIADWSKDTLESESECVCHSNIWDSNAAKNELQDLPRNADNGQLMYKGVLIDWYIDGTVLAASGTTSANACRIRFANMKGPSRNEWHDVGIAPWLDFGSLPVTSEDMASVRLLTLHRFIFLVIESAVVASDPIVGFRYKNEKVVTRLSGIVADNVACRECFCLKHPGKTSRDCSTCATVIRPYKPKAGKKTKKKSVEPAAKKTRLDADVASNGSSGYASSFLEDSGSDSDSESRIDPSGKNETEIEELWKQKSRKLLLLSRAVKPLSDSAAHGDLWHPAADGDVSGPFILKPGNQNRVRNPADVVGKQLRLAKLIWKRDSEGNVPALSASEMKAKKGEIRELKKMLRMEHSASELPPAFAAFFGSVNGPNRLYFCALLDTLHDVDEGEVKRISDHTTVLFKSPVYTNRMSSLSRLVRSKTELVRIANERVRQLSRYYSLSSLKAPFKEKLTDLQSGFSGQTWRALCPLLPYVLMGLRPGYKPDEDDTVNLLLRFSNIIATAKGHNQPAASVRRSEADLNKLQDAMFKTVYEYCVFWNLPVNCKAHKLGVHFIDSFLERGTLRDGETSVPETGHKPTKSAYSDQSNKRKSQLGAQLVTGSRAHAVASAARADAKNGSLAGNGVGEPASKLLLTRFKPDRLRSRVQVSNLGSNRNETSAGAEGQEVSPLIPFLEEQRAYVRRALKDAVAGGVDPTEFLGRFDKKILKLVSRSGERHSILLGHGLKISAAFEWAPELGRFGQTIWAKYAQDGSVLRRDGVIYVRKERNDLRIGSSQSTEEVRRGVLLCVTKRTFKSIPGAGERTIHFGLVLRLEACTSTDSITFCRTNPRLKFVRPSGSDSLGKIMVDVVDASDFRRSCNILPDLWQLSMTHQKGWRASVQDAISAQGEAYADSYFFEMKNIVATSHPYPEYNKTKAATSEFFPTESDLSDSAEE